MRMNHTTNLVITQDKQCSFFQTDKLGFIVAPMQFVPKRHRPVKEGVPMVFKKQLYIFWNDERDGLRQMIDFILDTFPRIWISYRFDKVPRSDDSDSDSEAEEVEEDATCCYEEGYEVLHHILQKTQNIGLIYFLVEPCIKQSLIEKLFTVCSGASCLYLNSSFDTIEFTGFETFAMQRIHMSAPWLTADHLISLLNCEQITVNYTKLTSEDLNKFIKHWRSSHGNFTMLKMESSEPNDFDVVLRGIENEKLDRNQYIIRRDDQAEFIVEFDECDTFTMKAKNFD
uniref:FBA_2 domain-containing protein n=1 Tax=Caenorhabditis tropicalis TaxID=1561998 RepID=A0A1I7UT44_9PELO